MSASDLDAFLAAWQDDEPDEQLFTVRPGAVPTDLLIAAKQHIDNVVREMIFERTSRTAALPPLLSS